MNQQVDEKQLPVFNKSEAAVMVMMGVADPFQFSSILLKPEEWAEFPKPIFNRNEESTFDFQIRYEAWRNAVGMKVRKRLAYYLVEKLKRLT